MTEIDRETYDSSFGPTTGDRVRLADTNLFIEITEDRCVGGDEAVFGGGKSIRESMGQSRATRAEGTPDLVVTGVVVLDHWGVIKADVGIRDGRITALGHAGNPETMDGIHPDLVIGPSTEVMAGNGLIMTAGTVDTHVHYVQPDMLEEALAAGTTTVVGGGTGPTEGSKATLATPGPWWTARMLEAFEPWPVNVLFLARGNTVSHAALWEQLRGGAAGFKVHEDWGATPAAIDAALTVADQSGVQVAIHSDTLNEAGFVEDLLAAVKGRTFHAFHTEGAGGGHAPDIIRIASEPYVLPASTNPTRPFTVNTVAEHLDMVMVAHHLNPQVPNDLAFAESRVRAGTIAAEDVLQDMGALSIMSSDAQAMGRIGEVVTRTWQTAHRMKQLRGSLPGDGRNDNHRARRYVAKYTICPAVAHGLEHEVGSIAPGKMADFVLWQPALFGVRPTAVFKGGMAAIASLGDPNASIPTPQPVRPRLGFNAHSPAAASTSVAFVSEAAIEDGLADRLQLRRRLVPITNVRGRTKADCRRTPPCRGSRSIPTATPSPSTASASSTSQPPRCRWHSGTSSSNPRHLMHHAALLLLADGRLPAGGYAHSGGLEPAIQAGQVRDLDDVAAFIGGRLDTVGQMAATFAAAACRAAQISDGARLDYLDAALDARSPSPAVRATSRQLGRQLLRTVTRLRPDPRYALLGRQPHQPLTLGVVCAVFDLSPHDAALTVLHETAAGVAGAAVRLLSLDPVAAYTVLARHAHRIDDLAATASVTTTAPSYPRPRHPCSTSTPSGTRPGQADCSRRDTHRAGPGPTRTSVAARWADAGPGVRGNQAGTSGSPGEDSEPAGHPSLRSAAHPATHRRQRSRAMGPG